MITYNEIDFNEPKSLFKFTKISEYTYSSLINKATFFSKAIDLNDPFEFDIDFDNNPSNDEKKALGITDSDGALQLKKLLDETKSKLNSMLDRNRILSLSSNPYELLMWSHYAEEHKGICIEYDRENCELLMDRNHCQKVIYPHFNGKTKINIFPLICAKNEEIELLETIIFARKASNWKYENEWRVVLEDSNKTNVQLLFDSVKIKSITFGLRTASHHKLAIFNMINKIYDNEILFYQTVKSNSDLAVEMVEFDPDTHVSEFMAPTFKPNKSI
jgi:hypothetical protein